MPEFEYSRDSIRAMTLIVDTGRAKGVCLAVDHGNGDEVDLLQPGATCRKGRTFYAFCLLLLEAFSAPGVRNATLDPPVAQTLFHLRCRAHRPYPWVRQAGLRIRESGSEFPRLLDLFGTKRMQCGQRTIIQRFDDVELRVAEGDGQDHDFIDPDDTHTLAEIRGFLERLFRETYSESGVCGDCFVPRG